MQQKFTDQQFLEGYDRGISDIAMAKEFKCSQNAVRIRRCKFKLVANFKPWVGEKKTPEELFSFRKQNTNTNRVKRQKVKYNTEEDWRKKSLEKSKKHHKRNLEKDNERSRKNYHKNRDKRLKQMKEYHFKNREKRLKQMKEYDKIRKRDKSR